MIQNYVNNIFLNKDLRHNDKQSFRSCTLAVLILASLCLYGCSSSNKDLVKRKSDREALNLKGEVKSYYEQRYEAREVNGISYKDKLTYLSLDHRNVSTPTNNGLLKAEAYAIWARKHEFDVNGNLIEKMDFDENNNVYRKLTSHYTSNNEISEEIFFDKNVGSELKTKNIYNDRNKIKESIKLYSNGEIYEKTVYQYDSKNNLKGWINENPDLKIKCRIEYDANSKERTEYKELFSIGGDNANNVNTRTDTYDSDGNMIRTVFYFEADGNIIKSDTKSKYDKYGNKIESVSKVLYNGIEKTNLLQYYYDFDIKGNWVFMYYYFNDKLVDITERTYEYYK